MAQVRKSVSLWCSVMCCALSGCATSADPLHDPTRAASRSVYVIQRGWHTGIAVAKADWPNQHWPLLNDFPAATYLEFGWGDERFYQAEKNTIWLAIRAALWPTSSVVHVIGLRDPATASAQANEVVEVRVPAEGVERLAHAIEQEFAGANPVTTGVTLRAAPTPNRFYEAQRRFFFPRMCNWWIATRLQEAGCPVAPGTVIAASRVMREARECAASASRAPHR